MQLSIRYNSQRDNLAAAGVAPSSQCGYTACAMTLSAFIPEAAKDEWVMQLVRSMETPGGEIYNALKNDQRFRRRLARIGAHGEAYAYAAQMLLDKYHINASVKWFEGGAKDWQIERALDGGSPVMLSTMLTGSGHFVCVIGYEGKDWIVHDPWGGYNQATDVYDRGKSGEAVRYSKDWLRRKCSNPHRFWYVVREYANG